MKIWQICILAIMCSLAIGLAGGLMVSWTSDSLTQVEVTVPEIKPEIKVKVDDRHYERKCPKCETCVEMPLISRYRDDSAATAIEALKKLDSISVHALIEAVSLAIDDKDSHAVIEYYDLLNFIETRPNLTSKARTFWNEFSSGMEKAIKAGSPGIPYLESPNDTFDRIFIEAKLAAL